MSDLIRCINCQGRKQIIGLGNMTIDCMACKAVGFVPILTLNKSDVVNCVEAIQAIETETVVPYQSSIAERLGKRVNVSRKGKGV